MAFVKGRQDGNLRGPILFWDGVFTQEFEDEPYDGAPFLSDINVRDTWPGPGLQIFEGWLEVHGDPDAGEVYFCGKWRDLTWWETCKLREGIPPWFEPPPVRVR